MPELPEVESFRKYFDAHALKHEIVDVKVTDEGILGDFPAQNIYDNLIHQKFQSSYRHGKFMFAKFAEKAWVLFHFGMTGDFRHERADQPVRKHDRVIISFSNGNKINYVSQRKLGKVLIVSSPEQYMKSHKFGPDALQMNFTEFKNRIHHRKRPIKSALLEQSIIAGIGNLYADEALFQTGIHPSTPVVNLTASVLLKLFDKVQSILTLAVANHANYGKFPKNFFIHYRSLDGNCPKCSQRLDHLKIGGRTTIFCPKCQKLAV